MTFYPIGNADTCLIDLANGRKVLFDFADMCSADDEEDKRIDLSAALRKDLKDAKRTGYDIHAVTHLDNDHTCKADEFFISITPGSTRRATAPKSERSGCLRA